MLSRRFETGKRVRRGRLAKLLKSQGQSRELATEKTNPCHEAERRRVRERYISMPIFRISVVNHSFSACDEHELPSLADATRQGIKAALEIGTDEVTNGKAYFGAEVRVEDGEENLRRFVVSVGMSPIQ